jgi:hypothetical protein
MGIVCLRHLTPEDVGQQGRNYVPIQVLAAKTLKACHWFTYAENHTWMAADVGALWPYGLLDADRRSLARSWDRQA